MNAARPGVLLAVAALLTVVAFQLWITPKNPPGYHRDEATWKSLNLCSISKVTLYWDKKNEVTRAVTE